MAGDGIFRVGAAVGTGAAVAGRDVGLGVTGATVGVGAPATVLQMSP
jgi:hypothetical protein